MVYKKIDYTANKNISELMNTYETRNISSLALLRRSYIMLLIRNNIINDLNISLDSFYSERELIEE
jgi:hypothetical protein